MSSDITDIIGGVSVCFILSHNRLLIGGCLVIGGCLIIRGMFGNRG